MVLFQSWYSMGKYTQAMILYGLFFNISAKLSPVIIIIISMQTPILNNSSK